MTGFILRNDVLRGLHKPFLLNLSLVSFVAGIITWQNIGDGGYGLDPGWIATLAQLAVVLPLPLLLVMGRVGRRARPSDLALPVPAQVFWQAHMYALLLATGVLVGANALAYWGLESLLLRVSDRPQPGLVAGLQLVLRPGAVSLLLVAVVVSWRPGLANPSEAGGWSTLRLVVGIAALVATGLLIWLPAWVCLLPVVAAPILVRRSQRLIGPSFTMASNGRAAGAKTDGVELGGDWNPVVSSPWQMHGFVLRSLFKGPGSMLVMVAIVLAVGLALSGVFTPRSGIDAVRVSNFFLIVYVLFTPAGTFIARMGRVDHLPIARRSLLAWLVLPPMVCLCVGYGVGMIGQRGAEPADELMLFNNDSENYGLKLPPRYFDTVWSPNELVTDAAWGESQKQESWQVMVGLPLYLVKSFSTPEGSTLDFVAWQISRAVTAVYGQEISPDEIATRYLETDQNGRVAMNEGGLTLQQDYPDLRPVGNGPVFVTLIGSLFLVWGVVLWVFLRLHRISILFQRTKDIFIGVMSTLMVLHVATSVGMIIGWYDGDIIYGLIMANVRGLATGGTAGVLIVWVVVGLLLLAVARVVDGAFAKLEAQRKCGTECA